MTSFQMMPFGTVEKPNRWIFINSLEFPFDRSSRDLSVQADPSVITYDMTPLSKRPHSPFIDSINFIISQIRIDSGTEQKEESQTAVSDPPQPPWSERHRTDSPRVTSSVVSQRRWLSDKQIIAVWSSFSIVGNTGFWDEILLRCQVIV